MDTNEGGEPMMDLTDSEERTEEAHPKVTRCVAEASQLAEGGDVKAAFLFCQSWLIDHQDAVLGKDIAPVYALMGKLSEIQDKPERAQKYYRRAQDLDPGIPLDRQPEIRISRTAALQQEEEEPTVVTSLPVVQGLPIKVPPLPTRAPPLPQESARAQEPPLVLEALLVTPSPEAVLQLQEQTHLETAGFFLRTLAFFVDFGLVVVLTILMTLVSALLFGEGLKGLIGRFSGDLMISLLACGSVVFLFLVYHGMYARIGGQTLGKILLDIRIIGPDGHSISSLQALRRTLGVLLAALPGLGGLLWVGFDSHHRGWHDYLADTYVIKVPSNRSPRP